MPTAAKKFNKAKDAINSKRLRSYVLRQGRMTSLQEQGFVKYQASLGCYLADGLINPETLFAQPQPLVLEIGFGMGASLLEQAQKQPEFNFIGIEVHEPGVGKLLSEAGALGLTNLKVFHADAVQVLEEAIPDACLYKVQVFFPDPWHKTKHQKRRLIQPPLVELIQRKLINGGLVHLATDWEDYAQQMLTVMQQNSDFINTASDGAYVPRPETRPLTKFELRGERLGHGVWDLIFKKEIK